jgi:hypothetical protein
MITTVSDSCVVWRSASPNLYTANSGTGRACAYKYIYDHCNNGNRHKYRLSFNARHLDRSTDVVYMHGTSIDPRCICFPFLFQCVHFSSETTLKKDVANIDSYQIEKSPSMTRSFIPLCCSAPNNA